MEYFDSHAHVNCEPLLLQEETIRKESLESFVIHVALLGDSVINSIAAIKLQQMYPDFYVAGVGIHPHEVETDKFEELKAIVLTHRNAIAAIGEVGLDYHYKKDEETKKKQKELFLLQISLANDLALPLVIHTRDATQDTFEILNNYDKSHRAIIHCFSDSLEMAVKYVKLGYLIGIGGVLTFKNAVEIKKIVAVIPLENIVIETDSPYLTPVPFRGEINMPKYVIYVAQMIAEIKNISLEEVARITSQNAKKFYGRENK